MPEVKGGRLATGGAPARPRTAWSALVANDGRVRILYCVDSEVKHRRRRGFTRVSAKNQVTLPAETLRQAGLRTGDALRAEVRGPGEVLLVRDTDPVERFAGALTGVYPAGELDELRDEWD